MADFLLAGTAGQDADKPSALTAVFEVDHARGASEQGVVFGPTHIQARFEPGTSLANDDGTARHQLSTESFDSQPL